jgi:nicotinamidase-related amidase
VKAAAAPVFARAGGGKALLDTSDSVILLLDHQAGLFQTVKDIGVAELRANTIMLAKLATLLKMPVITTASEPNGPNGPLMPEIHQFAPHAVYVPRRGEVNAWDNEDFVKTVRATASRCISTDLMFLARADEYSRSRSDAARRRLSALSI